MAYQYSNAAQVSAPSIYDAVALAVSQNAFPLLPLSCIRRGLQNRTSLPASTNEYAVLTLINRERVGTNARLYTQPVNNADNGKMTEKTLWDAQFQVSFFSEQYLAEQRAESFKTFFRGFMGATFFAQYGIGTGYCDEIILMEVEDGGKMQLQHAALRLHVQYWSGIQADLLFIPTISEQIGINLYPQY